jgi:hypothetical protein
VLSTVLGMSPLLLGGAEVFGLLQPLAIALTGALLVSIPLACILLPGMAASLVRGFGPSLPVLTAGRVVEEVGVGEDLVGAHPEAEGVASRTLPPGIGAGRLPEAIRATTW